MIYHDHDNTGVVEQNASCQVFHTHDFLGIKCYSCGFVGCVLPKSDEPEFHFEPEEIFTCDDSGEFIANILPPFGPGERFRGINWPDIIERATANPHLFVLHAPKGSVKTHELAK
jgi:hypothetical protein